MPLDSAQPVTELSLKTEARRRARMVLWALSAVSVLFIGTTGIGLNRFAALISNEIAAAAAKRNVTFASSLLAEDQNVADTAEAMSPELLIGSTSNNTQVLWGELRKGVIKDFQLIRRDGLITDSSRTSDIGKHMPVSFMEDLRQGRTIDTREDAVQEAEFPVGTAAAYAPLIQNEEVVGAVGVWVNRSEDAMQAFRLLQLGYFAFSVLFLAFAVPTGVVLRRYLLHRFMLEEELNYRSNELSFGEVVAQIGYWSLLPQNGRVVFSGEARRLLGLGPDKQIENIPDFAAIFDKHDSARIASGLRDLNDGNIVEFRTETGVRDSDDGHHDLRIVARQRADGASVGLFGVLMDITAEKRFRRSLRESESKFRLLADNASDVMAFYGQDHVFKYVSPSIERITGYKHTDLIGSDVFKNVHPDDRDKLLSQRSIGSAENRQALWRLKRTDGVYIWMESNASVIPDQGNPGQYQIISLARDVTDRVKREEELRRAQKDLDVERRNAEKANAAKSQFLATMSHELRTPMTGIIGMAELLLGSALTAEQTKQMQMLSHSANILLDLLNEILDLSKIESGKLELETVDFRLIDVFREAREITSAGASAKGLLISIPDSVGPVTEVSGDRKHLRQVLINLMSNAVKFTAQGSIRVEASEELQGNDVVLTVAVIDTGIGISEQNQKRLFQAFAQAEATTARRFGGTGLGLSISKHLVTAMGGDIAVVSEPGKGSTFTFKVKLQKALRDVPKAGAEEKAQSAMTTRPLRVLLAEDTETSRYLVKSMLERAGHMVEAVENGEQAINAARQAPFDIMLIDMHMPIIDGPEAMTIIRATVKQAKATPIIALTADMIAENHARYLEAGASTVVGKPVDWSMLVQEMARLTSHESLQTPAAPVIAEAPKAQESAGLDEAQLQGLTAVLGAEKMKELLGTFIENLERYEADILKAFAAEDLKSLKRAAHAMRGLSAQFGANELAKLAQQIEEDLSSIGAFAALETILKQNVSAATVAARRLKD